MLRAAATVSSPYACASSEKATSTFFYFKMADAGPLLHLATDLVKASAVARTTLGRRAIDLSAASRSPRMLVTSNKMC